MNWTCKYGRFRWQIVSPSGYGRLCKHVSIFLALGEWTETAFSNSYEITGLNTDTYYQVHINVESVAGTFGESEWSDTLFFKTREEDSGTGTSELDTIREQIVS